MPEETLVEVRWFKATCYAASALPSEALRAHQATITRLADELATLVVMVTDEMGAEK